MRRNYMWTVSRMDCHVAVVSLGHVSYVFFFFFIKTYNFCLHFTCAHRAAPDAVGRVYVESHLTIVSTSVRRRVINTPTRFTYIVARSRVSTSVTAVHLRNMLKAFALIASCMRFSPNTNSPCTHIFK